MALDGVGPSIALGSHDENGNCADLAAAEIAMKRAALKARERARQVGSGVAVLRDGKIVEERQDS